MNTLRVYMSVCVCVLSQQQQQQENDEKAEYYYNYFIIMIIIAANLLCTKHTNNILYINKRPTSKCK